MRAVIPPDLKIARSPCRWWLKLWRVPTAPLVDSRSEVLAKALTKAATIWGEFMMACLEKDRKYEITTIKPPKAGSVQQRLVDFLKTLILAKEKS